MRHCALPGAPALLHASCVLSRGCGTACACWAAISAGLACPRQLTPRCTDAQTHSLAAPAKAGPARRLPECGAPGRGGAGALRHVQDHAHAGGHPEQCGGPRRRGESAATAGRAAGPQRKGEHAQGRLLCAGGRQPAIGSLMRPSRLHLPAPHSPTKPLCGCPWACASCTATWLSGSGAEASSSENIRAACCGILPGAQGDAKGACDTTPPPATAASMLHVAEHPAPPTRPAYSLLGPARNSTHTQFRLARLTADAKQGQRRLQVCGAAAEALPAALFLRCLACPCRMHCPALACHACLPSCCRWTLLRA